MQNESSRVTFGSTRDSAYVSVCRCMLYRTPLQQNVCLLWLFTTRAYRHAASVLLRFALEFLFNPEFDLETDYIIRKPLLRRIQRYILRREILSTFHTRVDNRSSAISALYSPPNCPFPFDDHHQNLIHPYGALSHSPPQTASRSIHPCRHCSHVRTDRWR